MNALQAEKQKQNKKKLKTVTLHKWCECDILSSTLRENTVVISFLQKESTVLRKTKKHFSEY